MASTLPVDDAHLIGLVISLLLYGIYVSLFFMTLWVYKPRHNTRVDRVRWAVVVLFLLTTGSTILFIVDNFNAWIRYRVVPGSLVYFNRKDNLIGPWKDLFMYSAGIVGDSLIIWRLYIIWSRSKRIIIAPVIALIAYGAGGVLICYCEFRTVLYNNDDRFLSITADLTLFTILGGLATNLYSTSLIVGRIWWTGRQVQMIASTAIERRRHAYMPIIRALVESAALHTATMITTVIASILVKNASIIFGHIDPMVIGIAPTLLVLQLNIVKLKTSGESTLGLKQGGAGGVTTIRFSPMNPSTTVNTGTDMLGTFDTGVGANGQWDGPRDIENQACRLESIQKSKGVVEDMVSVDNKEKPSGVEDKDEKAQTFELKEEAR